MKKLVFIMPLMAISLFGCNKGGGDTPGPSGTFTITLKNDGDPDKKIENIEAGSIVEEVPDPTTPKPDSSFIGWCTDNEGKCPFDFKTIKIYQDYTLYAGWEEVKPVSYKVTFDAGDGSYSTGDTLSVDVQSNTKLSLLLNVVEVPTLTNKVFAYYKYDGKGDLISYDDRVTSDVTLKAQYFDASKVQQETLDFTWEEIKQVAVTNKNPSACFKLGATKKVKVNEKEHDVRIIDFKHEGDITKNGNQTGITFEFANVITKSDGSADVIDWDESGTNYKYSESFLNNHLNVGEESIFMKLPDLLKADGIIEEVYKPVAETESYEINDTYITKLFPLSYREITAGDIPYYAKEEGTAYAFYTGGNRIKYRVGSSSFAEFYWLRSPDTNPAQKNYVWSVLDSGGFGVYPVTGGGRGAYAIAPAFCI